MVFHITVLPHLRRRPKRINTARRDPGYQGELSAFAQTRDPGYQGRVLQAHDLRRRGTATRGKSSGHTPAQTRDPNAHRAFLQRLVPPFPWARLTPPNRAPQPEGHPVRRRRISVAHGAGSRFPDSASVSKGQWSAASMTRLTVRVFPACSASLSASTTNTGSPARPEQQGASPRRDRRHPERTHRHRHDLLTVDDNHPAGLEPIRPTRRSSSSKAISTSTVLLLDVESSRQALTMHECSTRPRAVQTCSTDSSVRPTQGPAPPARISDAVRTPCPPTPTKRMFSVVIMKPPIKSYAIERESE